MNRRGLLSLGLAAERFIASMLARGRRPFIGRQSKMWAKGLDAELLVNQAGDLGAVGPTLGLAHDLSDDGADGLGVSAPDPLGGVGVGLDGGGNDGGELSIIAGHGGEALGSDDLLWVSSIGEQPVEDLTSCPHADALGAHEGNQLGYGGGGHLG